MRRPTCQINNHKCHVFHLCLKKCSYENSITLPCEVHNDEELKEIAGQAEEHYIEQNL